jgi:RNA polymerase sigma-70 factor (ECF subfamily)
VYLQGSIHGTAGSARIMRPKSNDALLAEQIRCGDADAGRAFVRDQYPRIYRYLLGLTGCPEQAADLTQETFLRAFRSLDTFNATLASLATWMHRIAYREFLQALRGRRPEDQVEEAPANAEVCESEWQDAVELREVLRNLPPDERQVLVLHYLEDRSCEEISEIVGVPVGTVKYRLFEGRASMRRQLDVTEPNRPGGKRR